MNEAFENIIPDGLISSLEQKLGLIYISEAEEGNVCFANNNAELRDEFKRVFTRRDVLSYIKAMKEENGNIPLPESEKEFWDIIGR